VRVGGQRGRPSHSSGARAGYAYELWLPLHHLDSKHAKSNTQSQSHPTTLQPPTLTSTHLPQQPPRLPDLALQLADAHEPVPLLKGRYRVSTLSVSRDRGRRARLRIRSRLRLLVAAAVGAAATGAAAASAAATGAAAAGAGLALVSFGGHFGW
jgi:hypothetical protein